MNLTEFLEARIAEDEGFAKDDGARAMMGADWKHYPADAYEEIQRLVLDNSRRVMRECAAKRQQIAHLVRFMEGDYAPWNEEQLQIMATVYADHADFREEWRA